jgi:heme oxygenase
VRPNLLVRLKQETAAAHERIEQVFDLDLRTRSLASYRDLLVRLYGFHAAWEPRADTALGDRPFFSARQKTHLLHNDLLALGVAESDLARLPLCIPTVPLRTPAEALGSMYVVEGSTLGGTIIARYVEHRLGLTRVTGCCYFRCYGKKVGQMWNEFGAKLSTAVAGADEEIVISSAARTFDLMHQWLRCS